MKRRSTKEQRPALARTRLEEEARLALAKTRLPQADQGLSWAWGRLRQPRLLELRRRGPQTAFPQAAPKQEVREESRAFERLPEPPEEHPAARASLGRVP
ncbi:hypothetical protein [Hyalangium sp.]|uniref:hypothetical protein n=1 Tax=Hyalangium sp. TaxID=2028555 RepID=UPI002D3C1A01|nr:hypothetical protein [Hyalangium sp.]HYH98326.1 hypothetical protein [Hyalangium sp.]